MDLSQDLLMDIAAIAIALIGFSGVVTALGRRGSGKWSPSETLQIRTLVDPCIVTFIAAFVPLGLGLVTANVELIWRTSNAVVFVGHVLGFAAFLRRGTPDIVLLSQKIWSALTMVVLLGTLGSALGLHRWHQLTFLMGLALGIGVSLQNFYLLLFPARKLPVDD